MKQTYVVPDYWVFELCPSSDIPKEDNIPETGSLSVLR
jgi:hypothetical protein